MAAITESATIRVMRSHEYCQFECGLTIRADSTKGLSPNDIEGAIHEANRNADLALQVFRDNRAGELRLRNLYDCIAVAEDLFQQCAERGGLTSGKLTSLRSSIRSMLSNGGDPRLTFGYVDPDTIAVLPEPAPVPFYDNDPFSE